MLTTCSCYHWATVGVPPPTVDEFFYYSHYKIKIKKCQITE